MSVPRKRNSISLRMQKGDLLAVGLVLALCCAVVFVGQIGQETTAAAVEVYVEGTLIRREPLHTDCTFTVTASYTNTVCISGGTVCVSASDCPGGDCVHSGPLSTPGAAIVCLPNRVELRIVGPDGDVDWIVG